MAVAAATKSICRHVFSNSRKLLLCSTRSSKIRSFLSRQRFLHNKSNQAKEEEFRRTCENYYNLRHRIFSKNCLFTVGVGVTSLVVCGIAQYERKRAEVMKAQLSPEGNRHKYGPEKGFRHELRKMWNDLGAGKKMLLGVCLVYGTIFVLMRVPANMKFMHKHFVDFPINQKPYTLLTSTFAHEQIWHYLLSCLVMYMFGSGVIYMYKDMGSEQFLSFLLTAGCFASLVSNTYRMITMDVLAGSLGASGALYALLVYFAYHHPNEKVYLFPIPVEMPLYFVVGGLLFADLCMLIFKVRSLDNLAHYGGALFGLLYAKYGEKYFWDYRIMFVRQWHRMRQLFS